MIKYNITQSCVDDFELAVEQLLEPIDTSAVVLSVTFFGRPLTNEQYTAQRYQICNAVDAKFGSEAPVVTYVAQPPMGATLAMEVQITDEPCQVLYRYLPSGVRYIVVRGAGWTLLRSQGVGCVGLSRSIADQATEIFSAIAQIINQEGMSIGDIVRQWNYIEKITAVDHYGQNYQQFNDARSQFYSLSSWPSGYPAATGIGMTVGGVVVVVDLWVGVPVVALDNSLQVAAHEYSYDVLVGDKMVTTPKFERAKSVGGALGGLIYISGTAAIRGQQSLARMDIAKQTIATIENIENLIGAGSRSKYGIFADSRVELDLLRIYLKRPADYLVVRALIEKRYPFTPSIYVLADICRTELLIEVEGVVGYGTSWSKQE